MEFIEANVIRYEKNGFGRSQPVWSRGLVNVSQVKTINEDYAPEGMEGRVCVLRMFDGTEVVVKDSIDEIKYALNADTPTIHTHAKIDEMDDETKAAFARMVEAAVANLMSRGGVAP